MDRDIGLTQMLRSSFVESAAGSQGTANWTSHASRHRPVGPPEQKRKENRRMHELFRLGATLAFQAAPRSESEKGVLCDRSRLRVRVEFDKARTLETTLSTKTAMAIL